MRDGYEQSFVTAIAKIDPVLLKAVDAIAVLRGCLYNQF